MSTLLIFYDNYYQPIQLDNFKDNITIGNNKNDTVTIQKFPFTNGSLTIEEHSLGLSLYQNEQGIGKIHPQQYFEFKDGQSVLKLIHFDSIAKRQIYFVGNKKEITFSNQDEQADIFKKEVLENSLGFSLLQVEQHWVVESSNTSTIYINGERSRNRKRIGIGDLIFTPFMLLRLVDKDLLEVISFKDFESKLTAIKEPKSEMKKKYPIYRRTPRMVYELPQEKVSLSFPAQEHESSSRGIWLIIAPPLIMLIVMGIVALIQPRGIFIIVTMVMFVTTLVTSSVQYFKDKKNVKEKNAKRVRVYTLYLENKRKELQELADKQRFVLDFHFPTFQRMKYLTNNISDRIWERAHDSNDFLQFRLGTGTVPSSFSISANAGDMANREMDHLVEQSQHLENVYKNMKDAPIVANLLKGPIGLIGKEQVVKSEIHQIIGQLAFFHSYHDLRFILIFDEKNYDELKWMKWLPHFKIPNMFAKGFIYNEKTRDQLLSSLYEMIRERDLVEDKKDVRFSPHYTFIITNQRLIEDHVILEYLEGDYLHLGISVIFATETKESLNDNISTLVRYINDSEGDILIQHKKAVKIPFRLDHHQREDNEPYARMLRTLDHQMGMTNSIPESVSFLEMMDVERVEELPISENWMNNESSKSLAAPIGLKGKNDFVYLNLHEKAHGPHGLLAGTTGSGKSEFLQTYILSLSVHFHPNEVAFLLIDYKGGGMAQPFRKLPHLLGVITNIEGSVNFTSRALASIRSELKRRQRLFDQYSVTHINDYTSLFKQQLVEEPLPHLFLISDEFAELKNEEPEFIRELVSAARIGRSLGVHLILATQKPGGIIDDQIWSNARFRVALKVQDATDSKEILKNADAAAITTTGRGYLQVGNNEVYELFQSAWSGAPYLTKQSGDENEVAIITDLGLIPLSNVSANESKQKNDFTEIDAVVGEIEQCKMGLGIQKLKSPWLPPLSDRINKHDYPSLQRSQISIGLFDEPEKQLQAPYYYELIEDGNIGIFGSTGYGKSFTVLTILLSIAENYSPEEVNYYLMDFGNGLLLPLKQLPHTADFFLMDEGKKIDKFMRYLRDEITRRRQLLQQYEVSSIKLYNSVSEEKLPIVFVAIENFDFVKEEMPDLEPLLNQFVRDGQTLGIYMIYTATRTSVIRQAVMNNLKTKIVHYLLDNSENYSVIGKTTLQPEPVPGRAIIKKDGTYFAQVFLPVYGDNDIEILEGLKSTVQLLNEKYEDCRRPLGIPMLPKELTMNDLENYMQNLHQPKVLPIGLDEETVQPIAMNLQQHKHCIIMGPAQRGKTNVLKVILKTALQQPIEDIGLFDSIHRGLHHFASYDAISYLQSKEEIMDWLTIIEEKLALREAAYLEQQDQSQLSLEPILLIVDDYPTFLSKLDSGLQERIVKLMKNYSHLGFSFIVSGNSSEVTKGYDSLTTEVKQIRQAILLMKKSEQTLITLPYDRKEEEINPGFGYYVLNGKEIKIQIPLCTIEREIYS
ncbi:type VII secretion protein EssC [Lysinibacillus sp. 54212]|uniref:type VII secretion protein EssC n=1 Tax=Lysinibacillus sp. 54212 TaxID=3119829 RepID=UPI002FC6F580